MAHLNFLVSYAYVKHELRESLGVVTEPLGKGRSYDFIILRQTPPESAIEELKKHDDPFATGERPL